MTAHPLSPSSLRRCSSCCSSASVHRGVVTPRGRERFLLTPSADPATLALVCTAPAASAAAAPSGASGTAATTGRASEPSEATAPATVAPLE